VFSLSFSQAFVKKSRNQKLFSLPPVHLLGCVGNMPGHVITSGNMFHVIMPPRTAAA
jgi:hypothetical protein